MCPPHSCTECIVRRSSFVAEAMAVAAVTAVAFACCCCCRRHYSSAVVSVACARERMRISPSQAYFFSLGSVGVEQDTPRRVDGLVGSKVQSVAVGEFHMLVSSFTPWRCRGSATISMGACVSLIIAPSSIHISPGPGVASRWVGMELWQGEDIEKLSGWGCGICVSPSVPCPFPTTLAVQWSAEVRGRSRLSWQWKWGRVFQGG